MTQDELKVMVGRAALDQVVPGSVVGVGTGSTVNCFIDALATMDALATNRRWGEKKTTTHQRTTTLLCFVYCNTRNVIGELSYWNRITKL